MAALPCFVEDESFCVIPQRGCWYNANAVGASATSLISLYQKTFRCQSVFAVSVQAIGKTQVQQRRLAPSLPKEAATRKAGLTCIHHTDAFPSLPIVQFFGK
jgi:hypothetical protein